MPTKCLRKIVCAGNTLTGKSSYVKRLVSRTAPGQIQATVGVDFAQIIVAHAGVATKLHIWDTSGQENYRRIVRAYFRAAEGVLFFFDLTNRASFEGLSAWLGELDAGSSGSSGRPPIVIVGNKADMRDERTVSRSEATAFAIREGCMYEEISAATGENSGVPVVRLTKAMHDAVATVSAYAPRAGEGPQAALLPALGAMRRGATKCCKIS